MSSFAALTAPLLVDSYELRAAILASDIPQRMLAGLAVLDVLDVLDGTIDAYENTLVFFERHLQLASHITLNVNRWPATGVVFSNPDTLAALDDSQAGWLDPGIADTVAHSAEIADDHTYSISPTGLPPATIEYAFDGTSMTQRLALDNAQVQQLVTSVAASYIIANTITIIESAPFTKIDQSTTVPDSGPYYTRRDGRNALCLRAERPWLRPRRTRHSQIGAHWRALSLETTRSGVSMSGRRRLTSARVASPAITKAMA